MVSLLEFFSPCLFSSQCNSIHVSLKDVECLTAAISHWASAAGSCSKARCNWGWGLTSGQLLVSLRLKTRQFCTGKFRTRSPQRMHKPTAVFSTVKWICKVRRNPNVCFSFHKVAEDREHLGRPICVACSSLASSHLFFLPSCSCRSYL